MGIWGGYRARDSLSISNLGPRSTYTYIYMYVHTCVCAVVERRVHIICNRRKKTGKGSVGKRSTETSKGFSIQDGCGLFCSGFTHIIVIVPCSSKQ